ncbi:MAG: hypothetical protein HQ567_28575 [Candidatus Nealsonbacteria bacterium]|nr:hypothetical protein [Candidatus Nealsonbacteria bacterium]
MRQLLAMLIALGLCCVSGSTVAAEGTRPTQSATASTAPAGLGTLLRELDSGDPERVNQAAIIVECWQSDLANVLTRIISKDPKDYRNARQIVTALDMLPACRAPQAIRVLVGGVEVRPAVGQIVLDQMDRELVLFPYAKCLALMGRDAVPEIVRHLKQHPDKGEVSDKAIDLYARALRHIYGRSGREEGKAMIESHLRERPAENMKRLLDAFQHE